jgi:transcriptional regulator of acetoin/glycerol metabolism
MTSGVVNSLGGSANSRMNSGWCVSERSRKAMKAEVSTLEAFVGEAERSALKAVLARHDGRVGLAAATLGISRKTLWEKCRRHGLRTVE